MEIDTLTNNLNKALKEKLRLMVLKVKIEKDIAKNRYEVSKCQEELRAFVREN